MLFDVVFFGLPLVIAGCLAAHAVREQDPRFWLPSGSTAAYCLFYLFGGREVLLYFSVTLLMAGGLLNSGGMGG
ncbi:MAG: hypothetical protein KC777_07945 [Cyanobacteria bacterium HKST-UBA02]|nr:hypothetical protein [Cyanobacteria bacterium HKST-UBA02]